MFKFYFPIFLQENRYLKEDFSEEVHFVVLRSSVQTFADSDESLSTVHI